MPDLSPFPMVADKTGEVPVWCVTPRHKRTLHRFFDTSPISPSGRFLAVTQLPYDDRLPRPGDKAEIILVDLHTGEERSIASTAGWDTQLGAQVQWGVIDSDLYFSDVNVEGWSVETVKYNILTDERQVFGGPLYMVSPDGSAIAGPDLKKIGKAQVGYGVHVPPDYAPGNQGAPKDDGVYLTDVTSGKTILFLTIEDLVQNTLDPAELKRMKGGDFYIFHVKWNPNGTRMMIVLRWLSADSRSQENMVTTVRVHRDRTDWSWSDPQIAVPADVWAKGGHHPNWCPDGDTILMNLKLNSNKLQFCTLGYDGENLQIVAPSCRGSGHPTMHPRGTLILTDCYLNEGFEDEAGNVPLRLVDMVEDQETHLLQVNTQPKTPGPGNAFRIDPHPAWDRRFERVAFNGNYLGERHVFVVDLGGIDHDQ